MPSVLVQHLSHLATCDDQRREWSNASVLVVDGVIAAVGPAGELPTEADEVLDGRHLLAVPGMVNTHHHMFQCITRAVPQAQNAELFGWLQTLYPIWQRLTPAMVRSAAHVAMAELLASGCTTSSDHLYLYPNGVRLEDTIEAAQTLGLRFVATRGSMSVGQSQGGLPPDALVEAEADILRDTQRVIEAWHNPHPGAMVQVAVAPCSPFSVSEGLMRDSAALARSLGVRLHTHLAENDHDVAYSQHHFGCTPTAYAERLGWVGNDVWHAHCVKLDQEGVSLFAATRTGVAHCPCSNMRLASGIAPVRRMMDAGVPVGLGVDGSASNDGAHMVAEARQAMLLARVGRAMQAPQPQADGSVRYGCDDGPREMTARDALWLATRGGAQVLGRDDIGQIAVGKRADMALFDLNTLGMAGGAVHDPVAALLLCQSANTQHTMVEGQWRIKNGQLVGAELPVLVERHNTLARALLAP